MRDVSTTLDMTNWLFAELDIFRDDTPRSAAMNMAIDEALLETARISALRFYRWGSPALSFGYFGKFADAEPFARERDLVRRWTGGGMVFHGEDLTYSIVIPAGDPAFEQSSMSIYENVHVAICDALRKAGQQATVAGIDDPGPGINDAGNNCFTNPVHADVMMGGRKVAGAAQRRTRRGLLQQGSIQHVDVANGLKERFAKTLCSNCSESEIDDNLLDLAGKIAAQKYATVAWLRKR